jgi:hypothetical protein
MNRITTVSSVLAALALGLASGTSAQESPKVGVVMGYPASVGVLWHVTENVAIRPDLTASRTTGDSTTAGIPASSVSSTAWQLGVGASALLYLTSHEGLRTYVSPRFVYSRNSSSTDTTPGGSASENVTETYSVAGSFGVQYSLVRRFAVFGEVGLAYAHQASSYSSSLPNVIGSIGSTDNVGTRGSFGVIFYF